MIEPSRRSLITSLVSLVAAPAIVRVESLMPVRAPRGLTVIAVTQYPGCTEITRVRYDGFIENRTQLHIIPAGGKASARSAEVMTGLLRHIINDPFGFDEKAAP